MPCLWGIISPSCLCLQLVMDVVLLLLCHMLWIVGGEGWLLNITMKFMMLWETWLAWHTRMWCDLRAYSLWQWCWWSWSYCWSWCAWGVAASWWNFIWCPCFENWCLILYLFFCCRCFWLVLKRIKMMAAKARHASFSPFVVSVDGVLDK